MGSESILAGQYDYRLAALSVLISILAAYAALDLAERITAARGGIRWAWLCAGACAMGAGMFVAHSVGMAAFRLPVPVMYDLPTVLLSLLTAMLASGVALFIVSGRTTGWLRTLSGSIMVGCGIAAMHYIGVDAMRLQGRRLYSALLVPLSILPAIIICLVAFQLVFAGRQSSMSWDRRKILSGLVLGLALPATHYLGMAAVRFAPQPALNGSVVQSVVITPFGLAVIVAAIIILLGLVYLFSAINRRFSHQAGRLTEYENQLQTIFDNLVEGIIVLDRQRKVICANRAYLQILGPVDRELSLEEFVDGLDFFLPGGESLPPEQRPSALALRGTFVKDVELLVRSRETGKSAICEFSTVPIGSQAGDNSQFIVSYRDVTGRKMAEDARSRLAAIVESSQDAIIGKDLNGIVTSWNRGAEKIFGYRAEEMIGNSIQRLLPAGREEEEDGILERIRNGEMIEQLEATRQRKDGKLIQVSLMISPIRDESKRIVGASKIARDITDRKLMERQLRQSQKMEAIGQLTGGIAHDFNNLLAIVIGNLGLLERLNAGNEDVLKRLRPAQKAAARGADLTRRLLALASKEDLNPASMRIEDAIQETIELAGRALGPEIKILTQFDPEVPPVYVDASGLASALLNLAVNARDAMPKGGTLTFSTQLSELDESFPAVRTGELKPGSYARIAVTDTGHGMSKETLDRALEPFFTTKPRNKGTGLGLAMVYGFARQSGGTARLYSELGYGTTVSLYLPLAGQPVPLVCEVPMVHPPVHAGDMVLVVDDESDLLEVAQAYLNEMGYSVLRADNAASALSTIAQYREINLMITDIIMPGGMNGVELAEKARQLRPQLKVIYSSGFPADALMEKNGTKVDGPILRKPYHRAEFATIIQRTLEGPPQEC